MVDDWLTIVLAIGLAVRIMRLITFDSITQPIRDRLSGFFSALVECPWCTGVWIAVPVGLSWWAWADQTWWQVCALMGTIAWACGALAPAGMPRQVEVAPVAPLVLLNGDEPSGIPHADVTEFDAAVHDAINLDSDRERAGGSD